MAGKKNYNVVTVTTGLTKNQASSMIAEISKAKNKVAPQSRSTAAITDKDGIGRILQRAGRQIAKK